MQSYLNSQASKISDAVISVAVVAIGTGVAIIFVPENVAQPYALSISAAIFSTSLILVPALRMRRHASSILRGENVLMLGLIYWLFLEPIQGRALSYGVSSEDAVTVFTACGIFAVGVWLGVAGKGIVPPKAIRVAASIAISDSALFRTIIVAFFLGVFYFAYSCSFSFTCILEGLGASRFAAPWSRGSLGDATALIEQLYNFGYIVPSLAVMLACRKGWLHPNSIIAVIMSLVTVLFLAQGGGRRVIGVAIGAAVISGVFAQARISSKMILVSATCVALLLAAMNVMLEYRSAGLASAFNKDPSTSISLKKDPNKVFIIVDENFYWFARLTQLFPDLVPYVGIQPIVFNLIKPVPRVFWPGKPVDAGYDLAKLTRQRGLSLTTTVVGEFYAIFGFIAIFFGGLFFGLIGNMWNNLLKLPGGDGKFVTLGLGLMNLFAGLRGMQDLVLMSYGLLAWIVIAVHIAPRQAAKSAPTVTRVYDQEVSPRRTSLRSRIRNSARRDATP
jgi:hypothetical protein